MEVPLNHNTPIEHYGLLVAELEYMRVADAIAQRIAKGELRPGARLPGNIALAEEYGVAVGTARKALRVLQDRGLIETLWGKGTFVKEQE
jgi:DNA-binding GntR family transcriptional regulator